MAGKATILAIDIGIRSLKVAEFSFADSNIPVLEQYGILEYPASHDTLLLVELVDNALATLFQQYKFKATTAYLSLSGQLAFTKHGECPVAAPENVEKMLYHEARQSIPFSEDEVVWGYQALGYGENNSSELPFLVTAVKREIVHELIDIVEHYVKSVTMIDISPNSVYNIAKALGLGDRSCDIVLNMGTKTSNLIFVENDKLYIRPIPIGGQTITRQISNEFGIPLDDAEEMKKRHGFVAPGGTYEEPDSEVAASISKISRNIMTRMHSEIVRSISRYQSQFHGTKPARLYLTGGSSIMPLLARFFMEKLRIQVDYINPLSLSLAAEKINTERLALSAHQFTELVGLSLRHNMSCPLHLNLLPVLLKKQLLFKRKIPYLLASAATIVICLAAIYGLLATDNKTLKNTVRQYENQVIEISKIKRDIDRNKRILQTKKQHYRETVNLLQHRNTSIGLLNDLQQALPPEMWLVSIKKISRSKNKKINQIDTIFSPLPVPSSPSEMWLEVKGHALHRENVVSHIETFRKRLTKSIYFSRREEDMITETFYPEMGYNNFTSFKLCLKLNQKKL